MINQTIDKVVELYRQNTDKTRRNAESIRIDNTTTLIPTENIKVKEETKKYMPPAKIAEYNQFGF
jgi:hypothetical protein